ncbi:hypothetical protein DL767_010544 [Monosporascus sp. MG133]|nr:hypothetical protein DL767_010544 [Monosporascus sp. MG133]
MDQIYRNAVQVNVHLSAGDAASDVACEALKSLSQYCLGAMTPGPEQEVFRRNNNSGLPWRQAVWCVSSALVQAYLVTIGAGFKRLPYTKYDSNVLSTHWRTYLNYHEGIRECVRRKERGEPLRNLDLTLSEVLLAPALTLDATRPEDKFCGLYGVCKRLGFELPVPDYSKPLAAVCTEATRAILSYETYLDILLDVCESSGWERGIPSWVPNFSGCIHR